MPSSEVLVIAIIGILVFIAHLFTEIFRRTSISDVLLLMAVGLVFGPLLGIVTPDKVGGFGRIFTTITLIVILFSGGLKLNVSVLKRFLPAGLKLTMVGFFASMATVLIVAHYLAGIDFSLALLLGAIVGGTGSAIAIPVARQLRLIDASRTIIYIEAALGDAMIILFTSAIAGSLKLGEVHLIPAALVIVESIVLAIVIGIFGAIAWSILLCRIRRLQNPIFVTMAFLFILYAIVDTLGFSGAISAIAFGIAMGNIEYLRNTRLFRRIHIPYTPFDRAEYTLFSEVEYVLKSLFFIYVGVLMRLDEAWLLWAGLAITLVIFIVRLPVVRISIPNKIPVSDVSLISAIGAKGLVSAYAAFIPVEMGITGGDTVQRLAFAIILFSIILSSALIFLINRTELSKVYGLMFAGFGKQPEAPCKKEGGPKVVGPTTDIEQKDSCIHRM